jgi:hypothetical protein
MRQMSGPTGELAVFQAGPHSRQHNGQANSLECKVTLPLAVNEMYVKTEGKQDLKSVQIPLANIINKC